MDLIYHYTSGNNLEIILSSGVLKVSEWEKKNNIKPAGLWLSLNPVWENTATKQVRELGRIRNLTKMEQHEKLGLIRFVLKFEKSALCTWKRYKHASNTLLETYLKMEKVGIDQNANPDEWFVSFKNIPLSQCLRCEKWNGNNWETIKEFINN